MVGATRADVIKTVMNILAYGEERGMIEREKLPPGWRAPRHVTRSVVTANQIDGALPEKNPALEIDPEVLEKFTATDWVRLVFYSAPKGYIATSTRVVEIVNMWRIEVNMPKMHTTTIARAVNSMENRHELKCAKTVKIPNGKTRRLYEAIDLRPLRGIVATC